MVGPPNLLGIVAHIEGSWISRRRRKLDLAKKEACASTASFAARAVAAALGRHRAVLVLPPPPRASALARSSPEDSPSAAKEAASAEAVNARQGITGRLDSGVNGIIGSCISEVPLQFDDSPSVLDDRVGISPSITRGEARSDVLGDLRGDPVVLVRVHNVAACGRPHPGNSAPRLRPSAPPDLSSHSSIAHC